VQWRALVALEALHVWMARALAGDPIAWPCLLVGAQLIAHTTLATPHLGIPEKAVQAVLALVAPGVVQTL